MESNEMLKPYAVAALGKGPIGMAAAYAIF